MFFDWAKIKKAGKISNNDYVSWQEHSAFNKRY